MPPTLSCPRGQVESLWSTDPSEPAPGTTIEEALRGWGGLGAATPVVVTRSATEAVANVDKDGHTVEVLRLSRWQHDVGGWFVESGVDCRKSR